MKKRKLFLSDNLFRYLSDNIKDFKLFKIVQKDIIEYAETTYKEYLTWDDVSTIEFTYMNIRFKIDFNTKFGILDYIKAI